MLHHMIQDKVEDGVGGRVIRILYGMAGGYTYLL